MTHRGVAEEPDSCAATQRDLGRPEKWADRNIGRFNKRKYKPLSQEKTILVTSSQLRATQLQTSFAEKALEVQV